LVECTSFTISTKTDQATETNKRPPAGGGRDFVIVLLVNQC
jgi:hypothetical protein